MAILNRICLTDVQWLASWLGRTAISNYISAQASKVFVVSKRGNSIKK